MNSFKIEKSKCAQCKLCVDECPVLIISRKTEYPEIIKDKEQNCMKCQHCFAVCPTGAISIMGAEAENSIDARAELPDSVQIENLMQLRRSVRKYKRDELDKNLIHRLATKALYAPTAKNENAVQFTIIDNLEQMDTVRELVYEHIDKKASDRLLAPKFDFMKNFAKLWKDKGIDIIFRNAPHFILASAPQNGTEPQVDSVIALTYFDLLANSKGLGTLWNGFAKCVFEDIAPELKKQMNIPENHGIFMTMVFGKPEVKYARSIQNENASISYITMPDANDVSLL